MGDTFSTSNALSALLTTESLLFAVFALSVNFAGVTASVSPRPLARSVAVAAALLLTLLATGAAVAWADLFLGNWPQQWTRWFPIVVILIGVIAQPAFAWVLVRALSRTPRRRSVDDAG